MHKKHIILGIHTAKRDEVVVSLTIDGEKTEAKCTLASRSSQAVLPLLEELCSTKHINVRDISEIIVDTGPGSFTGLRVGASIGNAISWMYKLPINGKPPGSLTELIYEGDNFGT